MQQFQLLQRLSCRFSPLPAHFHKHNRISFLTYRFNAPTPGIDVIHAKLSFKIVLFEKDTNQPPRSNRTIKAGHLWYAGLQ
ncbi:hypothetical protein CEXT_437971 [Caerostris extrusa]|uniref:Uncharacterized protein n=1 Tax=Caerostris extrusa TaxID=172846 RepID=A0AAV4MPP3_CAEEX|nr:hypothetical protein CEXT_437971 [Caerostris extrusa]